LRHRIINSIDFTATDDASERQARRLEALAMLAGAATSQSEFLQTAVKALAHGLNCMLAAVGQANKDKTQVQLLVLLKDGNLIDPYSYELAGTPCEDIYTSTEIEPHIHHCDGLCDLFPQDKALINLGAKGYRAEAFHDADGDRFGHVFIIDNKATAENANDTAFFRMISQRIGAEVNRWRSESALQESEQQLRSTKQKLETAIESFSDGFALFDADDRFVLANETYLTYHPQIRKFQVPGVKFEKIVKKLAEVGFYGNTPDENEALVQMRLESFRSRKSFEYEMEDGRWYQVNQFTTAEGGTAIVRINVTNLKKAEVARTEAENRFRAVVDHSSSPIFFKDLDGRFLLANSEYEKLYGVTFEEIKGKTSRDLFGDEAFNAILQHDEELIRTQQAVARVENLVGREYLSSKFPVFDGHGVIIGLGGIDTDVSELRRAVEARAKSEARFGDFAQLSSDWLWEMDEDLHFTYTSPDKGDEPEKNYTVDILGKTRWEAAGADPHRVEHWRRHKADLDAHIPFTDFRFSFLNENGERRYRRVSGIPVFDDAGEFRGYRGSSNDETEIMEAKEIAEAANRAKSEFLANMSHELRTPLNAVLGFSEVMVRETFGSIGNERYREYAADIHASGTHLLDLINDVLDLSRIEAGRLELRDEKIEINKAIEATLRMVRERAVAKGISLKSDFHASAPTVMGDMRAIKQIVLNLLTNAVKFTPKNGNVSISSIVNSDGSVVVCVVDTGIGIHESDIPTILEPFGQVSTTDTRAQDGSGLGLPLAKRLSELHGATFILESKVGFGTKIAVQFPPGRCL